MLRSCAHGQTTSHLLPQRTVTFCYLNESRWGRLSTPGESGELTGWAETRVDAAGSSLPSTTGNGGQRRARPSARPSPVQKDGKAVCDQIWMSDTTRHVARRLPEIVQTVLGFETSESQRLLLLGWEVGELALALAVLDVPVAQLVHHLLLHVRPLRLVHDVLLGHEAVAVLLLVLRLH